MDQLQKNASDAAFLVGQAIEGKTVFQFTMVVLEGSPGESLRLPYDVVGGLYTREDNPASYEFRFYTVGPKEIVAEPYVKRIQRYRIWPEIIASQRGLTAMLKINEDHVCQLIDDILAKTLAERLPSIFVVFGVGEQSNTPMARLYHPSAFPSHICLGLLQNAAKNARRVG